MAEITKDKLSMIWLDDAGVVRIGKAGVPLEEIVGSHVKGNSTQAVLARFPTLTAEELQAALDYHAANNSDAVPRGPQRRDEQWQRWNATAKEDNGTDTQPNTPISGNAAGVR
jgi:uncharacterized protein (DUF433 family)